MFNKSQSPTGNNIDLSKNEIAAIVKDAILCVDASGEYDQYEQDTRLAIIGDVLKIVIMDGGRLVITLEDEVVFDCEINPFEYALLSVQPGVWQDSLAEEAAATPRPLNHWTFDPGYDHGEPEED